MIYLNGCCAVHTEPEGQVDTVTTEVVVMYTVGPPNVLWFGPQTEMVEIAVLAAEVTAGLDVPAAMLDPEMTAEPEMTVLPLAVADAVLAKEDTVTAAHCTSVTLACL